MRNDQTNYRCKDGRNVILTCDDVAFTITVTDTIGTEIGRFEFLAVETESGTTLKMVWAFLDKAGGGYKRQGIGRRCISLAKDHFGLPIVVEDNDGIRRNDGSHLTGDAPAFVCQMRREELIASCRCSGPDDDIE